MPLDRIVVWPQEPFAHINPRLYGHLAEHVGAGIYEGIWVGEDSPISNIGGIRRDVVQALRRIHPPVIRWPGGCFADDYHWEDGIGPQQNRPARVNLWWGRGVEPNHFGTHEFLQLCRLVGAEPYIAGNLGNGSPRELRDWVEYCNYDGESALSQRRAANGSREPFGVRYWGVGNEPWGCGGYLSPEEYAAYYKRFANYMRDVGGVPVYLIAAGPSNELPEWTPRFFSALAGACGAQGYCRMHGCSMHYYCGHAGGATGFTVDDWYLLLHRSLLMEPLVVEQRNVMDRFDPRRQIDLVVDEWGVWHPPDPGRDACDLWRQNTMRDAAAAAVTLDIYNRHAHEVAMANIAQMVNVLQAMILTDGERMLTTPTYHVFDMYQSHQGGMGVRAFFAADEIRVKLGGEEHRLPGLSGSASLNGNELTLSVVNLSVDRPREATIEIRDAQARQGTATVLAHPDIHAHNTFDAPDTVRPQAASLAVDGSEWHHTFQPASVTVFKVTLA